MDSQWQIPCPDMSTMQTSAANMEQWASEIATTIPIALKCARSNALRTLISDYLDLDQAFEAFSAQVTLQRLGGKITEQSQLILDRLLADLSRKLMEQTQPLLNELQQHSDYWGRKMPEHRTWLTSLRRYQCNQPDFVQSLQKINVRYYQFFSQMQPENSSCRSTLAELLRQRVEVERDYHNADMPLALQLWGQQNDVDEGKLVALMNPDLQAVRSYIRALQHKSGLKHCTLPEFRSLEQGSMTIPALTPEEAVQLVLRALNDLDPQGARRVGCLMSEGRLAVQRPGSNAVPLCLSTPNGSYVRVPYEPDLHHLMLLMHELGHARHQEQHRADGKGHIPLTSVESEAQALMAEQALAHWLMRSDTQIVEPVQHYLRYQRVEMDYRHRMLANFELQIHRLPEVSEQTVGRLWLEVNRTFYGETIKLPDDFQWGWCELHHLFTAPFYLLAYPEALSRLRFGKS